MRGDREVRDAVVRRETLLVTEPHFIYVNVHMS